jgi:hypothetical protein
MYASSAVDWISNRTRTPGSEHSEPSWGMIRLPEHTSPPSWRLARSRALPLLPIWPGLAADTAIYGGVFAGLLVAVPAARRAPAKAASKAGMVIFGGICEARAQIDSSISIAPSPKSEPKRPASASRDMAPQKQVS